ncbi:uncharacterized protein [Macrobrachium rosenbergii]|uniref:uncharacterized protein n=1 Tax=Macrobrachium rosenbergii TaxID=79674 RepID=UPI0034D4D246
MAGHGIPRLPKYLAAAGNASNFASEEQLQKTKTDTSLPCEQPSHHPPQVPKQIQRNIMELLKCYPEGLEIEKFNFAYLRRFGRPLIASEYGFLDVVDLLDDLKGDILKLPYTNGQQLLLKVNKDIVGEQCGSPQAHEKVKCPRVPNGIIEVFKTIVKKNGGGISLENLKYEFETITHKQLDLASLGFSCIYDLVASLSEIFKICKSGSQFILSDSNIKTVFLSDPTASNVDSQKISRTLSSETKDRLAKLLREEFPAGLTINEIVGAYKGLFGAELDDLNPLLYGYRTLQALLKDHHDVVLLIYANDTIMVHASQFLWTEELTELTLSPVNAVSAGSVYKILDQSALLPIGEWIEVMVAEVYSPEKFWVVVKGSETSGALNCLMGKLFEFYNSKVGDRYMVSPGLITIGAPVVAYFAEEQYYCRALITSVEDVRTVKLFLVDYGIVYRCDYSHLRQLHQNFFALPAQAVKAALDDIVPPYGKGIWPKQTSQRFLNIVQNKDLVAKVTKLKENAYMELWDTSGGADINIAHALIVEGLAFSDSPLDCGNMPYKKSASDQGGECTGSNLKLLKPNATRETVHSPKIKLSVDPLVESINCMTSIPSENNLNGDGIRRNSIFDTFSTLDHVILSETNCSQKEVRFHKLAGEELTSCSNLCSFTQSDLVFSDPLTRKKSFEREHEIQQHHQLSLIPNNIQQNETVVSQNLPSSRVKSNGDQGEEYTSHDQMDLQTPLVSHEWRNLPECTSFSPCRSEEKLMRITPQSSLESAPANTCKLPHPSQFHTLKYVPPPPGFEDVFRFLPVPTHTVTACPPKLSTSVQDFGDHDSHQREGTVHQGFHSVELVKLSDSCNIHILRMFDTPYMLAADILKMLTNIENLETALDEKGWKFPSISIGKFTDKDLYLQLFKLGSGVIFDEAVCEVRSCLSAYPLCNVPEILKLLGFNDKETADALEELIKKYKYSEMCTTSKSNVTMNSTVMDNFIYEFSKNAQVKEFSGRATLSGIDGSNLRNSNFEVPQSLALRGDGNVYTSIVSKSPYVNEYANPAVETSSYISNIPLERSSAVCQPVEFTNTEVSVTKGSHLEHVFSKEKPYSPTLAVDKNQFSASVCPALPQEAVFARKTGIVSPKAVTKLDGDKIMKNDFHQVCDKSSLSVNTSDQPMFDPGLSVALPISNCLVGGNTTSKISDAEKGCKSVFAIQPTLTRDPKTSDVLDNTCVSSMETSVDQFQCTTGRDVISVTGGKETVDFSEPSKLISCLSLLQNLEMPRNRWLRHNVSQSGLRKPSRLNSDFSVSGSVAPRSQEKLNSIHCVPIHQSDTVSEKENGTVADCCKPTENVYMSAIQQKTPNNLVAAGHSLNSGSCEPGKNNSFDQLDNSCLSSDVSIAYINQMTLAANKKIGHHNVLVKSPFDLYTINQTSLKDENQNPLTPYTSASASVKKVEENCHSVNPCGEFRGNDRELYECDGWILHKNNIGDPQNNMNQAGSKNISLPQLASGSQIIHDIDEHHKVGKAFICDRNVTLPDVTNEELGKKNSLFDDQTGSTSCGLVTNNLQCSDRKYPGDNNECEARNNGKDLGTKGVNYSQFSHDTSLKINISTAEMSVVEFSEKVFNDSNMSQCCEEDGSPNKKPVSETEVNSRVSHLSGCTDCEDTKASNVREIVDRSSSERCDLEVRNVTYMEQATRKVEEKAYSLHKSEEKYCTAPVILHNSPVDRIISENSSPELPQTPPQPRVICQLSTEEAKETEADVEHKQLCHATSMKIKSPSDRYVTNTKMPCELSSGSGQNSKHVYEKCLTSSGSQLLTEEEKETKAKREYDDLDSPPNAQDCEQLLEELNLLDLSLQLKKQEYKTIVNSVTDATSPSVHHTLEKLKLIISELKKSYKKKRAQIKNLNVEPGKQVHHLEMEKQPCHATRLKVKSPPDRHTTNIKKPCELSSGSDQNSKDVWEKCPTNTELALDQVEGGLTLPLSLSSNHVTVKNPSITEETEGHKTASTMFTGNHCVHNNNLSNLNYNQNNFFNDNMNGFDRVSPHPEMNSIPYLPHTNFEKQISFGTVPYPVYPLLGIQNRRAFSVHVESQNRYLHNAGYPLIPPPYLQANPGPQFMLPVYGNTLVRPVSVAFSHYSHHTNMASSGGMHGFSPPGQFYYPSRPLLKNFPLS